jgi:hypothetical protein
LDAFKARGWRNGGQVALAIVEQIQVNGGRLAAAEMEFLSGDFLAANETSVHEVGAELKRVFDGVRVADRPELVPMEEIDTYARAAAVGASAVAHISKPLLLSEETVKTMLAKITGEPFVMKDWGGEPDDLFTTRVILGGRAVAASFILKGPAKKGPLTLAKLGKNGDQMVRMMSQPADLFVVQHCDVVAPAIRSHLRHMIRSLRASSNPRAVGSVWDGNDTARLLVAHGLVDRNTGEERRGHDVRPNSGVH